MMAREVEETIISQEPRISKVDVNVEPRLDKGCLIIDVNYTIAASHTRENFVFPFYLDTIAEDGEYGEF
jgi:predicted component of type VI protein secretion system